MQRSIAFGLDLGLALAVGRFGLLENVDDVLGLRRRSVGKRGTRGQARDYVHY